MMLTKSAPSEVKNFFEENGYYLARNVFSAAEVTELEGDFDRIVAQLQTPTRT